MDSLGFALEEILATGDLKSEFEQQPKWKKVSKIVILILIALLFFGFLAYQVMIGVKSYNNPGWTSSDEDRGSIQYPGVLLCPASGRLTNQTLSFQQCTIFTGGEIGNETSCSAQTAIVKTFLNGCPHQARCLNLNSDNTAMCYGPDSYFYIEAQVNGIGHISAPLLVQLYDASQPVPQVLKPTFLINEDSTSYAILARTEYTYLNKSTIATYTASTSSVGNNMPETRVTMWSQAVFYDWVTILGVVAGGMGFLRSIYYVIFLIVEKIHDRCTKKPKDEDDASKPLLVQDDE